LRPPIIGAPPAQARNGDADDEHLRALRFLALHRGGCTEATLLELGFTPGQLGYLVYAGLAKLRRKESRTATKVFPG
jgi:hypothetical protein